MITHLVLFTFRPGVSWDDPRALEAEQATLGHPAHIPQILSWTAGRNISPRSQAQDFALVGTFADQDALAAYADHPDHYRGVGLWREISTWVVADLQDPDLAAPDATGAAELPA